MREEKNLNICLKILRRHLSTCLKLMSAAQEEEHVGTKRALRDAAAALFAENGFENVSLREITGRAGANVASVKYHFGSKESLVDAVVTELVSPVNQARLKNLDCLEREGDPSVRKLLHGFFDPLLTRLNANALSEQLFFKLMGRLVSERSYELPEILMAQFHEVAGRYVPAFQQAIRGSDSRHIFWSIHFSFGVMSNVLMHGDLLNKISKGLVEREEMERTMERAIDFCEAGFLNGSQG